MTEPNDGAVAAQRDEAVPHLATLRRSRRLCLLGLPFRRNGVVEW